jgi:hypothetical protein
MATSHRQTRNRARNGRGIGVDASGAPVVDPTENVLALVQVEKEHAQELRAADKEAHAAIIAAIKEGAQQRLESERRFQDGMRAAESKRIDDLAEIKRFYDDKISVILTTQVTTTSELISGQLEKVTTSLSNQITTAANQAAGLLNTLSDRTGRLEQRSYESSGRTSVSDPATNAALQAMAESVRKLSETRSEGKGALASGERMWGLIAIIIAAIAALGAFWPHISPSRLEPVYQAAPPVYQGAPPR